MSAPPNPRLFTLFWITQELGGVRNDQDGNGWEPPSELQSSSSETFGWRHGHYVHILYSLWFWRISNFEFQPKFNVSATLEVDVKPTVGYGLNPILISTKHSTVVQHSRSISSHHWVFMSTQFSFPTKIDQSNIFLTSHWHPVPAVMEGIWDSYQVDLA